MEQVSLMAIGDNVSMNKLCDMADKLMEVMTQDKLIQVCRLSDDVTQIQEENKLLKRQIGDLTKKIQQLQRHQHHNLSRSKHQYTGTSQKEIVISVITTKDSMTGVLIAQLLAITSPREMNKPTIFVGKTCWYFKLNLTTINRNSKTIFLIDSGVQISLIPAS